MNNRYFRLTKIGEADNPKAHSAISIQEYRDKMLSEPISPNISYYVIGRITREPKIGESFMMERISRNDVKAFGLMTTSPVQEILHHNNKTLFTTQNSIYSLEEEPCKRE